VVGVLEGNTPDQQHAAWMADKLADGWVYGAVKDAENKTHPCMVPYEQLPTFQQLKDSIYIATVKALAGLVATRA
jgi:hypothetical protein